MKILVYSDLIKKKKKSKFATIPLEKFKLFLINFSPPSFGFSLWTRSRVDRIIRGNTFINRETLNGSVRESINRHTESFSLLSNPCDLERRLSLQITFLEFVINKFRGQIVSLLLFLSSSLSLSISILVESQPSSCLKPWLSYERK